MFIKRLKEKSFGIYLKGVRLSLIDNEKIRIYLFVIVKKEKKISCIN